MLERFRLAEENALALLRMAELEDHAAATPEVDAEILVALALEPRPFTLEAIGPGREQRQRIERKLRRAEGLEHGENDSTR
jgi:hypothetical protein